MSLSLDLPYRSSALWQVYCTVHIRAHAAVLSPLTSDRSQPGRAAVLGGGTVNRSLGFDEALTPHFGVPILAVLASLASGCTSRR